jgi:hypothetical protein
LDSKPLQSDSIPVPPSASVNKETARLVPENRLGFLIPSFSDLVFIVLLAALSCGAMGTRLLNDAGIGWHIRNGEQILSTHSITRADIFSSTMNGHSWYAWEWFYDVMIAAIHSRLGLNGVVFFSAAIIALTFALVLHHLLRRGTSLPVTALVLVLAIGASMIHVIARPHVLSWLLAVIFYKLLEGSQNTPTERRRLLFWIPVLMLFWVNLHGGFLLGFALIGISLLGGWIENLLSGSPKVSVSWLKHVAAAAGLALIASFANPYGYKLYVHIFEYLSNPFLMNHISEFLSPDFHSPAAKCFLLLLIGTLCALAISREKLHPTQLFLVVFAVSTGLQSSRNLPVSSILLVLVVAPLLSDSIKDAANNPQVAFRLRSLLATANRFSARMNSVDAGFHDRVWALLAVLIGLWVCAHSGMLGSSQMMNAHFDEARFPVQAAAAIVKANIREPVFCPDLWGGYLIYALYPQIKVVADDRHDLYGEEFFKDYLRVTRVEPGWEEILSRWDANYALVPTESPVAAELKEKSNWAVVHQDTTAVLLHRGASLSK